MTIEKTDLKGKRILVTGGTTGIGRATVALLAEQGARVLTFGRHEAELKASIEAARGDIQGLTADVATAGGVARVFAAVDEKLGGLDILVNNAGVAIKPVQDMSDEDWRYGVETDFLGYLACARAALERMKDRGGHIVFVGSVSADQLSPGTSTYAATKAGIAAYAETLRKEVADRNVKVTLIEPGLVRADLQGFSAEQQEEKIAQDRMLLAEELADAILFSLTRSARTDVVALRVEPRLQHA
ncbi:SDR family oxidoreductase [Asticcacaulis solisilvae]|uniref:SDR family oxidoreductase n=1 Tax=Asticcacaulis solisilvae TaxID=1217274 RepID=UPI003FD8CD3C